MSMEEMSEGEHSPHPAAIELTRDVNVRYGPTFSQGEVLYLQPNKSQYARRGALIGDPCLDATETLALDGDPYWKPIDIKSEIQSIIDTVAKEG